MDNPRVYLAGPEIFLLDPLSVGAAKMRLCARYGFEGIFPLHLSLDFQGHSKKDKAYALSMANERLIRNCQLMIANMTPFRGPSTDVGTAFEMGFARALGIPVFAYTNAAGKFQERTAVFIKATVKSGANEKLKDHNCMFIEDYGLVDNLMLDGAVHGSGEKIIANRGSPANLYTDLRGFKRCLRMAADRFRTKPMR